MSSALLLAAGKATRLGAIRDRYAKACVPVGGTTALRFAIEALLDAGVSRFVVNLHWQAEQVWQTAQQAVAGRAELLALHEEHLLGTGGSLCASQELLGELPDLVMNAKVFTDLNWRELLDTPAGTLVVHPASRLNVFGGLRYCKDGKLLGLQNRDAAVESRDSSRAAVYTGLARPSASWLPYLHAGRESLGHRETLCLARAGFLAAMHDGVPVSVLEHHGYWCEISTPERVAEAEAILSAARHAN